MRQSSQKGCRGPLVWPVKSCRGDTNLLTWPLFTSKLYCCTTLIDSSNDILIFKDDLSKRHLPFCTFWENFTRMLSRGVHCWKNGRVFLILSQSVNLINNKMYSDKHFSADKIFKVAWRCLLLLLLMLSLLLQQLCNSVCSASERFLLLEKDDLLLGAIQIIRDTPGGRGSDKVSPELILSSYFNVFGSKTSFLRKQDFFLIHLKVQRFKALKS